MEMKRVFAAILALILALCAGSALAKTAVPTGVLAHSAATQEEFEELFQQHLGAHHQSEEYEFTLKYYDNMTSMLMALRSGEIYMMAVNSSVADYMVARNEAMQILPGVPGEGMELSSVSYSMLLREDSEDLQAKLNEAILSLKADGTLDALVENSLKKYISSGEPGAAQLPNIEGAETVTVAVTGDQPPMDFIAADGNAAGFNVELLAAISERAGVNFELMIVDSAARLTALSSGRADVVFWASMSSCVEHPNFDAGADVPDGVLATEPYFTDQISFVIYQR